MGFRLAAAATGLLIVVASGSAFYIKYQANEIATLKANSIILEGKIEEQNASIDNNLAKHLSLIHISEPTRPY